MVSPLPTDRTLIQAAHAAAWGNLSPPPWIRLGVVSTPDISSGATWLEFSVRIDPHEITSPYFSGTTRFSKPGGAFGLRQALLDRDFRAGWGESQVIDHVVVPALRSMAGHMREEDPRIGIVPDDISSFPRALLFDPPRMRPPMVDGRPTLDSVPCPFCQMSFGRGMPAMWGGGNLLWVHPSCWARAHTPP